MCKNKIKKKKMNLKTKKNMKIVVYLLSAEKAFLF